MFRSVFLSTAGAVAVLAASTAAHATTACTAGDISPAAVSCVGFYSGNLLNNANVNAQYTALASLDFTWDKNWNALTPLQLGGSQTVNFPGMMYGISYVGIHYGNGRGGPGNATAFYKIDAGAGLDSFTLKYLASSNAVLYHTGSPPPPPPPPPPPGVPEPATWALMIGGFGMVGTTLRRRRSAVA